MKCNRHYNTTYFLLAIHYQFVKLAAQQNQLRLQFLFQILLNQFTFSKAFKLCSFNTIYLSPTFTPRSINTKANSDANTIKFTKRDLLHMLIRLKYDRFIEYRLHHGLSLKIEATIPVRLQSWKTTSNTLGVTPTSATTNLIKTTPTRIMSEPFFNKQTAQIRYGKKSFKLRLTAFKSLSRCDRCSMFPSSKRVSAREGVLKEAPPTSLNSMTSVV